MAGLDKIIAQMQTAPNNVRFADLAKLCEFYFGKPRQKGGSHIIFKTPLAGRSAGEYSKQRRQS